MLNPEFPPQIGDIITAKRSCAILNYGLHPGTQWRVIEHGDGMFRMESTIPDNEWKLWIFPGQYDHFFGPDQD